MVDCTETMQVPLPVHLTQKLLSSINNSKNGKNDGEKTFNRYVRQLVDQYLDKEVVISKQPEDKVELIVQACREKFPDFAHWTTTRIRIYIESCRRLKKIKNSPILLAKRKAAGRRFREGQKLKKIISSQLSMQATESQRHLAEYLLKANQAQLESAITDEPMTMLNTETDLDLPQMPAEHNTAFKSVYNSAPLLSNSAPLFSSPAPLLSNSAPLFSNPATTVTSTPAFLSAPARLGPLDSINSALSSMMPQLLKVQQSLTETSTPASMLPTFLPTSSSSLPSTNFVTGFQLHTRIPSPPSSFTPTIPTSTTCGVFSPKAIRPVASPTTTPPPRCSPLKLTITLPDHPNISPSSSDSGVSCSLSYNASGNASTSPDRSISPKQKNFQIDSLMNSVIKSSPTRPKIDLSERMKTTESTMSQMLDRPLFPTGEMSMTEILNAKTLVTSYREAANFLYRAASELEQLLPNDHRVF
ncbi:mucin-2-like [Bolinopsis microptera]|uniref:mucin-2-like n=1 Tax=Bolinopsis microptera TaxID=2820187 RepID=UPI00307AD61E